MATKVESWGERVQRLREAIDANRAKIFSAAAAGVDAEQYVSLFFQAIGRNKTLAECTLSSLIYALTDSAVLGLPCNSIEGDGYLVPRKRSVKDRDGNWTQIWEAQFQAGYLGKLKLAYESPLIAGITVETVFEGDTLQVTLGTVQTVTHIPHFESERVTHVYAVMWLASGCRRVVCWSASRIDSHKAKYSAGHARKDSAWNTSWQSMARKTVLLDLLKFAPVSDRARRVMQTEEYENAGVDTGRLRSGDTAPADDLDRLAAGAEEDADPAPASEAEQQVESEIPW